MKNAGSAVELFIDSWQQESRRKDIELQGHVQCSCLSLCICQDFHGHSKKEGIFFYGGKAEDRDRNGDIQLLPRSLVRADIHHQKLSLQTGEGKTGLLGTEIFCIMEGRV